MISIEKSVLAILDRPLTKIQIAEQTGLSKEDIDYALTNLHEQGLIFSRGINETRKHMRLTIAIEELYKEIEWLRKRN